MILGLSTNCSVFDQLLGLWASTQSIIYGPMIFLISRYNRNEQIYSGTHMKKGKRELKKNREISLHNRTKFYSMLKSLLRRKRFMAIEVVHTPKGTCK